MLTPAGVNLPPGGKSTTRYILLDSIIDAHLPDRIVASVVNMRAEQSPRRLCISDPGVADLEIPMELCCDGSRSCASQAALNAKCRKAWTVRARPPVDDSIIGKNRGIRQRLHTSILEELHRKQALNLEMVIAHSKLVYVFGGRADSGSSLVNRR